MTKCKPFQGIPLTSYPSLCALVYSLSLAFRRLERIEFASRYTMEEADCKDNRALVHRVNAKVLNTTKICFTYVLPCGMISDN
jgi:hypothetical protein